MKRPDFLTSPGVYVRCSSRITDAARDARAIERSRPGTNPVASVVLALVIGIAAALLLVHWAAS